MVVRTIYCKDKDKIEAKKEIYENGFWTIDFFCSSGYQILFVNSKGYKAERTFDKEGNQLTYKNSDNFFRLRNQEGYYTRNDYQTELL